ncbi:uncharacterized protein [Macrobrachium rosenbergii]|uniref:uncharacterized protein n=1 Tax=Macrobrachium rosenbergii TaxID=79674 RepID=UPI0034D6496A
MQNLRLLSVLAAVLAAGVNAQGSCQIDIDSAPQGFNPPLLVNPGSQEAVYPELEGGERLITFPAGGTLVAACTGERNRFELVDEKELEVSCMGGRLSILRQSEAYSQIVKWADLGCQKRPRAYLRHMKNSKCGEKGKRYDIGWPIRPGFFVPLIHLCYDDQVETTEFTYHKVQGRSIGIRSIDSSRPGFRSAGLFDVDVNNVYKRRNQRPLFLELLGTTEHLTSQGQHYLARGHLAPDSDFFYTAEQDATYFYANVVPQWQDFNNGNWKRLEFAVRELAERQQATLDVWTGSYGVLQMPDANNNAVDMFLGLTEGKTHVPVPAVLWKVIHNPSTRRAVAIVGVNDVRGQGFSDDISMMDPPCYDVCDQLTWIDWDTQEVRRGRTFCCQVSDLKEIIPSLPNIGSVQLLTN